ncbi:VENN motif pre-toxin domain-containing protein [Arsenophonus apicola]|uniref:VENN motif pre-toxin domain-containing protein n=1 Tax=Arsenophonus apicola TaxID=2879119 RepID=UPI003CC91934
MVSLAGALASGTAEGAYSGADAGVIAVQNNFLSAKNVIDMKKELEEAERIGADKEAIYQKYGKISAENRDKATALVQNGTPFDAIGVWEELNGGVDLADSLKWATIFADLSAEIKARLIRLAE